MAPAKKAAETVVDVNTESEVIENLSQPQNSAHKADENPESHLGEETPDPWDDSEQTDWPNSSIDVSKVSN
jgi:hypothetical protein